MRKYELEDRLNIAQAEIKRLNSQLDIQKSRADKAVERANTAERKSARYKEANDKLYARGLEALAEIAESGYSDDVKLAAAQSLTIGTQKLREMAEIAGQNVLR